ncbi:Ig domain-containing protein [Pseudomonas sp. NPDC090202]|uniref:Ig-like domain-containing protein n=1 Tax=unclassified Pseudomonas TaxID=196821 RepID=UPI0037F2D82A
MTIKQEFLLPPPIMQNLHDPSGVGYADTVDPQVPLQVRVGPYVTIAAGDIIDLYCDNQRALQYTVRPEDLTPETPSFVVLPLDQRFVRPSAIKLHYVVTNPRGEQSTPSHPTTVPVKLTLPGGVDTNPATPYENERLALPKIFPEGIITSPDGVSVEIEPYLNMFVGDRITLSWNGLFVRTTITEQSQVGQKVVIAVPREIVEEAGDTNKLEVRYEIRDIVNNWSRWSLPAYTEVEAGGSALPASITPQAPAMELDLDALAGADVQVLVIAHPQIQRGDELVLLVERTTAEGLALETYTASSVINAQVSFTEFQVPNAQFQPLAQGRARLRYRVVKPSGETLRSRSLQLKIVGQTMSLLPPRVPVAEQNGNVLDPASRNVIAKVPPYYFMAQGNTVTLQWLGKTASGANVMHEESKVLASGDVGSDVDFVIPDGKVSVLAGGSVELYYTVVTEGGAFFRSPSLNLPVSGAQHGPLPLPLIVEAQNDVLDPENTRNGATVQIGASAELQANERLEVFWNGPNGSDGKEKIITASEAGKALTVVFASALVDVNVGERVSVFYRATRLDGQVQTSATYSVEVSTSRLDLPAPTMDGVGPDGVFDLTSLEGGYVPPGGKEIGVQVNYPDMQAGDVVKIIWTGKTQFVSPEQTVTAIRPLAFTLNENVIRASLDSQAVLTYQVLRAGKMQGSAPLFVTVIRSTTDLEIATSPAFLPGKVYLVPSNPSALPNFPAGTIFTRPASGGTKPYVYSSSNPGVAHVNEWGEVTSRGNGSATITVRDAGGQTRSYSVTVSGVVQCQRMVPNKYDEVAADAARNNMRLPTLAELREIHAMYAGRWPLDNNYVWSQIGTRDGRSLGLCNPLTGWCPIPGPGDLRKCQVKNLVNGAEANVFVKDRYPGVGIR